MKKALAERMLNAEMDVHLAQESEAGVINHRNGSSAKTVLIHHLDGRHHSFEFGGSLPRSARPIIADAIRDRLEHSALAITITGESYRGVKARKLANKKKDG